MHVVVFRLNGHQTLTVLEYTADTPQAAVIAAKTHLRRSDVVHEARAINYDEMPRYPDHEEKNT